MNMPHALKVVIVIVLVAMLAGVTGLALFM